MSVPVPVLQRFSDEEKDKIVEMYQSGKTHKEIGAATGESYRTIEKLLRLLGVHKNHKEAQRSRFDKDFVEQVVRMRAAGFKMEDIARITNRSVSAVHRVCSSVGVQKPSVDFSQLKQEYESGMNMADLASRYNTNSVAIMKELHKQDAQIRPAKLVFTGANQKRPIPNLPPFEDTYEWWYNAYTINRCSIPQIAQLIGRPRGFVHSRLRANKIELRSISESVRRLDHQQVVDSYTELGSMVKVATKLDCSIIRVKQILTAAGTVPTTTSDMFTGDGNPFFGKEHDQETRDYCAEIGAFHGTKFWQDHPEYVEVVKQKQKEIWSDLSKRQADSKRVAELRAAGRCGSRKGTITTRFGNMDFDSSYECRFIEECEKDNRIVNLERDFDLVEYEWNGIRHFVPDFRVWLTNGEMIVVEIKNHWLLLNDKEQAKIKAALALYADKFIVAGDDFSEVFDRVDLVYKPAEFDFKDVTIGSVEKPDYDNFYTLYHYRGLASRSGWTVGAILNQRVIACATISSISRNESASRLGKSAGDVRELVRFCIHPEHHQRNFASWFLSRVVDAYFKQHQAVTTLISFADTTQGHSGTIYKAAGWREDGRTAPSWHYLLGRSIISKKSVYDKAKMSGMHIDDYAAFNNLVRVKELPKIRFIKER